VANLFGVGCQVAKGRVLATDHRSDATSDSVLAQQLRANEAFLSSEVLDHHVFIGLDQVSRLGVFTTDDGGANEPGAPAGPGSEQKIIAVWEQLQDADVVRLQSRVDERHRMIHQLWRSHSHQRQASELGDACLLLV
jgi:hypothetical protein